MNIIPGQNGMPPVKERYEPNEQKIIATKASELGTKNVANAYGLKWQTIASWKRFKKPEVIIQTSDGHEITPDKIIAMAKNADKIYVRADENKAYWVKGNETGAHDLW